MLEYADLLGDCDKATQHRAQALSDSYAKEQVDMTRSYEQMQAHGRAVTFLEAAYRHQPSITIYEYGRVLLEHAADRLRDGRRLLRLGVEGRNAECCAYLGRCLRSGRIEALRPNEALEVLLTAARLRNVDGMIELGKLHQKTRSAPKLVYRAFNSAYQAGSARGAKWLAKCHRNGWGTQINREKADELTAEARDRAQREEINRLPSMVWSQKADPPAEKACSRWS
jgi:TPR repeat protein